MPIPQFLVLATGTLISEDLTCIAAGLLVAQGQLGFVESTAACFAGIAAGDLLLFAAGRTLGPRITFVSQDKIDRAAAWLRRRGLAVVFLSRFTPGLRLPTYVAAGALGTNFRKFALYFLGAAAVWAPLLVGSAAVFGEELIRRGLSHGATAIFSFAVIIGLLRVVRRFRRWEFWPAGAAYLPLVPYFLFLMCRYRSVTLFTAANPGIVTGGLAGESKSKILTQLARVPGAVPEFEVKKADETVCPTVGQAVAPAALVVKPDVGERGTGVAVVRSHRELEAYMSTARGDIIVQRYVGGEEFGIFYSRFPNESRGRVTSITAKHFPCVRGDGRSTIRELILRDSRAHHLARAYEAQCKRPVSDVLAQGEALQLVEIGSHCRGTMFVDGTYLNTPSLEAAVDRISKAHEEFYFGRFDVRAESIDALQAGRFQVIELNGVGAETTHIYDPAVSLTEAYRVMARQWKTAFRIGAMNRARGFKPTGLVELVRILVRKFGAV